MGYQGRSPINDVVRSVMSAAMLTPAMLVACGTQRTTPLKPEPTTTGTAETPEPLPSVTATVTVTATATATATTTAVATATATATPTATATASVPDVIVQPSSRPRGNGKNMPTRGFAGAVRARR